jgi:hypothetical protein
LARYGNCQAIGDIATTPNKEKDKCYHFKTLAVVLAAVTKQVGFGNMLSEDYEYLKDLVKGIHFESVTRDITEPGEKVHNDKEDIWPRNLRIRTYKPTHSCKSGRSLLV